MTSYRENHQLSITEEQQLKKIQDALCDVGEKMANLSAIQVGAEDASALEELSGVTDHILKIAENPVFKRIGVATGIIGVGEHLLKGFRNNDWFEYAKGVSQGLVLTFGGEELIFAYNVSDLLVTTVTDAFKK